MKLTKVFAAGILTVLSLGGFAQSYTDSVGAVYSSVPVAVPFLRMNQDIRASGMGETGVALPGAQVSHWMNPARLTNAEHKYGAALSYTPWMRNLTSTISLMAVSGYMKLSDRETLGAGFRYFKKGELHHTDDYGQQIGESKPADMAFELAYARKLSEVFSLGATFRYINSRIVSGNAGYADYKNGNAVAADLGITYNSKTNSKGQSWHAGAAFTNLGSKMKYSESATDKYNLPANLAVGGAFRQRWNEVHQVVISAELNKLLVSSAPEKSSFGEEMQYNVGGEYKYDKLLSVRAGYHHQSLAIGGLQYFTAGIGLEFKGANLDLAYLVPTGDETATINNTFRFGLQFHFK